MEKNKKMTFKHYLPEFVYGGIDGAITTFSVVAGSIGASLSPSVVLILGFANIVADGFSIAVSNYLSIKSLAELHRGHRDYKEFVKLGKHPLKAALVEFFSFALIGLIPLSSFIFSLLSTRLGISQFATSVFLTALALASVGAIKGAVVKKHWIKSSVETLLIGGFAAVLAFAVGRAVSFLL